MQEILVTTRRARAEWPTLSSWGRISVLSKLAVGYAAAFLLGSFWFIAGSLVVAAVGGIAYEMLRTKTPQELARSEAEAAARRYEQVCKGDDPYSASGWQTETKYAVSNRLKAPSTAKFSTDPVLGLLDARVWRSSDCIFTVQGEVDAQNSFGAMVRSSYRVSLTYDAKADKWNVIGVGIE